MATGEVAVQEGDALAADHEGRLTNKSLRVCPNAKKVTSRFELSSAHNLIQWVIGTKNLEVLEGWTGPPSYFEVDTKSYFEVRHEGYRVHFINHSWICFPPTINYIFILFYQFS